MLHSRMKWGIGNWFLFLVEVHAGVDMLQLAVLLSIDQARNLQFCSKLEIKSAVFSITVGT